MTREEHLVWCKKRALDYLDQGDVENAIASMGSDLMKHEETKAVSTALILLGLLHATNRDIDGARHWIEGFR